MTRRLLVVGLFLLLLAACSPDDWANRLPYAGPVEKGIDQGAFLPGSKIQYLGKLEDRALVSVDGKETEKKIGDPLEWKEDVLRGVNVDQTYRVVLVNEQTLHAAGTVRVIIWNAVPQPELANTSAPIHFKLPVGYHVDRGTAIPGTLITYQGKTDQGAKLKGIEGLTYRQVGETIRWEGRLVEGLWVRLDLRTALIGEETLDVIGTADLWIVPQTGL
jgi:hypothetical protein